MQFLEKGTPRRPESMAKRTRHFVPALLRMESTSKGTAIDGVAASTGNGVGGMLKLKLHR